MQIHFIFGENILVISSWSVLLVEEGTGVPEVTKFVYDLAKINLYIIILSSYFFPGLVESYWWYWCSIKRCIV